MQNSEGDYILIGSSGRFDSFNDQDVLIIKLLSSPLAIDEFENNEYPNAFTLFQNHPNPFNPSTTIKFILQKSSDVILKIYNLSGQEIEILVNEFRTAGKYEILWKPKNLPSGMYFYRLQAGEYTETKKLILQR